MDKRTYIKTVVVLFGLLVLSRVPALVQNGLSPLLLVSSVVELIFVIWGLLVLKKDQ